MTYFIDPLEEYNKVNRLNFRTLKTLEVNQLYPPNVRVAELTLVLTFMSKINNETLILSFSGVRNLKFVQPSVSEIPMFLEINSIKHYQWDGINYEIKEIEGDIIHFLCKDFDVIIETQ